MGLSKAPVVLPTMLSSLGKACARMDLTAVHDILLKTGYKDEEGAENEVWGSFCFHLCFAIYLLRTGMRTQENVILFTLKKLIASFYSFFKVMPAIFR